MLVDEQMKQNVFACMAEKYYRRTFYKLSLYYQVFTIIGFFGIWFSYFEAGDLFVGSFLLGFSTYVTDLVYMTTTTIKKLKEPVLVQEWVASGEKTDIFFIRLSKIISPIAVALAILGFIYFKSAVFLILIFVIRMSDKAIDKKTDLLNDFIEKLNSDMERITKEKGRSIE